MTAFSKSQIRHKFVGICNIKAGRQKKLVKTRGLKLSKTSRIVTAFSRQNTESQMVTIVTDTMWYLGK
jgi:hypothetical protein